MKYEVGYNAQDNNIDFGKVFPGWAQCMTTCAWMLMCFLCPSMKSNDDNSLAQYLDDVEVDIGNPGIGEWVKRKFPWINGHTSYWWLTQKYGMEKWLWRNGIAGEAVFENGVPFEKLQEFLTYGPVIMGTDKIGGLPGGHIILVSGISATGYIIKDPFGNAMTNYKSKNGDGVLYPAFYLREHAGETINCMYWRPKA